MTAAKSPRCKLGFVTYEVRSLQIADCRLQIGDCRQRVEWRRRDDSSRARPYERSPGVSQESADRVGGLGRCVK
jgi:hypothetical protein